MRKFPTKRDVKWRFRFFCDVKIQNHSDMKNYIRWIIPMALTLLACSCGHGGADSDNEMDAFVSDLMGRMTLEQKLGQMNLVTGGDMVTGRVRSSELETLIRGEEIGGVFNVKGAEKILELQRIAVEETSLGIPLLVGADIIHGYETIFPIPLALSCSWDTVAIERMARVSAVEASAAGINWTYSPMVDICRDPRWGRIAEGNGEDPYLGSVLGPAYVRGYQGKDMSGKDEIMSCVKHFALYGAVEGGRDYNTVDMSRQRMFNEYLPPYEAAIRSGAGSVMNSFNLVEGIPAAANRWLMVDVLRERWGFDGLLVTDYEVIKEMSAHGFAPMPEASVKALEAGTDMDMVSAGYLTTLARSLEEKAVTMAMIDKACRRVLEAKYRLGLFNDPYKYCDTAAVSRNVYTPAHRAIAREIAAETFVLLKNDSHTLPLQPKGRIALVGPMADAANNMCGMWSMTCTPSRHRSLLEVMTEELRGKADVIYSKGCNIYADETMESRANGIRPIQRGDDSSLMRQALAAAAGADVIVAAMGESAEMSGESASRTDIELPDVQKELLRRLVATGKPVVLLLFTGRPLVLTWEEANVAAILNVWFGGSEAAGAICDVVFGKVSPSGRLTTTFPRHAGQIPLYYNHMNTSRPDPDPKVFNRYCSNYLDESNEELYPFGYGLSYTTFEYGSLTLDKTELTAGGSIAATVKVTNTGSRQATETVQLYIRDLYASLARPVKELKGFRRITLEPGESQEVTFAVTPDMLRFYNSALEFVWEPGEFDLMVGPDSRNLQRCRFELK